MLHRTNTTHKLQDTVNDSRSATYQTSITVAGIVVGIEVSLLIFMKTDSNFSKGIGNDALLVLTYSTLFLSLSAAASALILTHMLGKIPAQTPKEPDREIPDSLRGYESSPLLTWIRRHWVFTVIAGTVLPIVQLLLYVWLEELTFVGITVSVIAAFATLPAVFLIPLASSGKPHMGST